MNEDMHFHDGILCKLKSDYFIPPVPCNKEFMLAIIGELDASPLGGHLAKAKLLEPIWKRFYW